MKTLIIQHIEPKDPPMWVLDCISSVEKWAEENKFEYLMENRVDRYYNLKEKYSFLKPNSIFNIIRRELLLEYLDSYDRVCWIDADTVIKLKFNLPDDPICASTLWKLNKIYGITPSMLSSTNKEKVIQLHDISMNKLEELGEDFPHLSLSFNSIEEFVSRIPNAFSTTYNDLLYFSKTNSFEGLEEEVHALDLRMSINKRNIRDKIIKRMLK